MSRVLQLSDEQYDIIESVAREQGRTPEDLLLAWTMEEESKYRREHPTYLETDAWLRHLGMADDDIQEIKNEIRVEAECEHDADA